MVAKMKLAFNLVDWQARAPGLTDAERWQEWATLPPVISATAELAKSTFLPMMTARRLASGSSREATRLGHLSALPLPVREREYHVFRRSRR